MDDEADVRLVDAHAEGDGRHHHRILGLEELLQPVGPQGLVEAGVIGQGRNALGPQLLGQLVGAVARAGVDHPGPAHALLDQLDHPRPRRALLALGRKGELGPGETVDELGAVLQPQLGADVVAGPRVGGGCDRQPGRLGEHFGQAAEHAVFGAEVVAPLADAVRLVDGDQGQRQARQPVEHRRLHQAFRRQVQKVERAVVDAPPDVAPRIQAGVGIELLGRHARLLQRRHLIGHQGDQRRDHQAEARADERGDLVAQALAAAGGQHRQGAAPGQHLADDAGLQAAEIGMAERPAQNAAGDVQRRRQGMGISKHHSLWSVARPGAKGISRPCASRPWPCRR